MKRKLRDPIVHERILPAPPEVVFRAWSEPASLRAWMLPAPGMRSADVDLDFRVGGAFRIVMHGEENDYAHHGEYLEIDPPKRLVMTWVSEWIAEASARTLVTVSLEPAAAGRTRLLLVHEELPDDGSYDGHEGGWAEILRKLAEQLEGR